MNRRRRVESRVDGRDRPPFPPPFARIRVRRFFQVVLAPQFGHLGASENRIQFRAPGSFATEKRIPLGELALMETRFRWFHIRDHRRRRHRSHNPETFIPQMQHAQRKSSAREAQRRRMRVHAQQRQRSQTHHSLHRRTPAAFRGSSAWKGKAASGPRCKRPVTLNAIYEPQRLRPRSHCKYFFLMVLVRWENSLAQRAHAKRFTSELFSAVPFRNGF